MKKQYYCEFKTWAEGTVDCPWDLAKFEELPEYRLRSDLSILASANKVKGIFLSLDSNACTKFLKDYVAALVLGVVLDIDDLSEIKNLLTNVFGYCEIIGIMQVTEENKAEIDKVMSGARITTNTGSSIS